ncbi:VOC family protein [Anditalea andensis]|uniref:Glyoxalase n=1 Tax=Anditalea andensis TaxID=1048983 RepID=A0A074KVL5_9BACT|nr:VOC family protein [Anditalea andensis]KEO72989.1 glyoxalase [Anditalea andensis]
MNDLPYNIPAQTRIGHIHLKVSDLQRSIDFYCGLLGFEITQKYGNDAAFISAGGYHHHIGLNVWFSKGSSPAPERAPGLFHTAILYPARKDLAEIYLRIQKAGYPFTGAADHGVSEALYLNDPDDNGVELYWDRPIEQWPKNSEGTLHMYTRRLDMEDLLSELNI